MKTTILLLLIPFLGFGQINEQRAMKERHIDFTKEYIFFTIHGLIEIDGHAFKNDTCKCPIQFQANLDGILIIDTCSKIQYEHRICGIKGCKIIHLKKKDELKLKLPDSLHFNPYVIDRLPSMENL